MYKKPPPDKAEQICFTMSLSEAILLVQRQLVLQRNLENRFLRDYTVEVWLSAAVGDRRDDSYN
jgi:hypothetical protein